MPRFLKRAVSWNKITPFYLVLLIIVAGYLSWLHLNPNLTWMQHEVVSPMIPRVLEEGNALQPRDFLKTFNVWIFESSDKDRSRFLSYFTQIVNIKFRLWLFQFIPPHPSLSITWILSLVLSPIVFFKWMRDWTASRTAAWTATLLYLVSPGALSMSMTLFHQGKPIASFLFILCLFLASRISRYIREDGGYSPRAIRWAGALAASLFLILMSDESAWFVYMGLPILYFNVFRTRIGRLPAALLYAIPLAVFLGFVTFGMPHIAQVLGYEEYNFWGYINSGELVSAFRPLFLFLNAHYLNSTHLEPFYRAGRYGLANVSAVTLLAYMFYGVCFTICVLKMPSQHRRLLKKLSLAAVCFIVYHTFLLLRHPVIFQECWYYGSLYSIVIAAALGLLLSGEGPLLKTMNRSLLIGLVIVFSINFYLINKGQMKQHTLFYGMNFGRPAHHMQLEQKLTWKMIRAAWRVGDRKNILALLENGFPMKSYWLFVELDYLHRDKGLYTQRI